MRAALALAAAALALGAPAATAAVPWTLMGPPAPATSIAFAATAGSSLVYAKAQGTWQRSADGGATWTGGGDPVCDLRAAPNDPATVYSGCGQVSRDAGAHWQALPTIEGAPQIDAAGTLYEVVNGTDSMNRCAPDGSSCTRVNLPALPNIEVDPASSGLLILTGNDGVSVSENGGATWAAPRAWPAAMVAASTTFDGRTPRKLILVGSLGSDLAFRVSTDAGASWGPARTLPFPHDADPIVTAGGNGAGHRIWVQRAGDAVWTDNDGVSFHAVQLPMSAGSLTVDPNDGAHLFLGDARQLWESHAGGAGWTLRNSGRFGRLVYQELTGSGSTLYATTERLTWISHDTGASWAIAPDLATAKIGDLVASRDDPRVAYAAGDTPFVAGFWRTLDAGQTWTLRAAPTLPPTPEPVPVIGWIQSGHPDWVFAGDSRFAPVLGSRNGGQSWNLEPLGGTCVLTIAWAQGSRTRGQAGCGGPSLFPVDPSRAPWDQAFGPAQHLLIDHAGSGALISTEPLGRINADWSFVSACTATMWPGFCNTGQNDVHDAWAAGGHVTYGYTDGDTVWAKLGEGRWWKLPPPPGSEKAPMSGPLVLLSHEQLVANGLLVPLQAPTAAPPLLALQGPSLYCTVELTADDADISYAWLRDGAAILGTRTDHPFVAADLGHDLTCVVTARNDWGSSTLVSAPYRVSPTTVIATTSKTRLALSGSAVPGKLLRCGAKTGVSWLRDGRALKGRHASTYRVRESDRGHTLACQARASDGTLVRSQALRVPRARGGHALPVAVRP